MSTKKRRRKEAQADREVTRKEQRLRAQDRERNRKLFTWVGAALGIALLAVLVGVIVEFVVTPNSTVARVGDETIVTKDFRRRTLLQQNQLLGQLANLVQMEQQFGGQGFFQNQINQIQSTLSQPSTLGITVLNSMINERVILAEAEKRGITISDAEIETALREEVAASAQYVTEPQATETAVMAVELTTTAEAAPPTPTATIDVSSTLTATATTAPTPTPWLILDDATYDEELANLEESIDDIAGMSLAQYKEVIKARLATEALQEAIGEEMVEATELQVNARHILLSPREPTPTPTPVPDGEEAPTPTPEPTALSEGDPTPTPTDAPRTREETLVEIEDLRKRIVEDGEDFAELAAEYSDDTTSAVDGGNLDWFGSGSMVPPFEAAAFELEVGEVSEPISTTFGYHLIEVLERDEERPKDESQLQQERSQAYQEWLQEQINLTEIDRPDDIESKLPARIRRSGPAPVIPQQQPLQSGGL